MKVDTPSHQPQKPERRINARIPRWWPWLAVVVIVSAAIVMAGLYVTRWERGYMQSTSIALGRLLRGGDPEGVPVLHIDVPFKDVSKIYAKREEALNLGVLTQGPDDFVNGSIRIGDKTVPVELRLKGDFPDHLQGRKWSLRIHVRRGAQLLGMRRFSVQDPATRGYHSEAVYLDLLRQFGIIVPRYFFGEVVLNGDSMGIMAIEEFFAKELLENNGRREGVIVRFQEANVWAARDSLSGERSNGFGGGFDFYNNATIDAFGSAKVAESEFLTRQYAAAVGLLRGYVEGRLTAAEVFDPIQTGQFLAIADLFGAWHPVRWHNRRFYLNPVTMLLEPIGFDINLQETFQDEGSVTTVDLFNAELMRDAEIFSAYEQTIAVLSEMLSNGSLFDDWRESEQRWIDELRSEYPFIGNYPIELLDARADMLTAKIESDLGQQQFGTVETRYEQQLYPVLLYAQRIKTQGRDVLELVNAIPRDLLVESIDWVRLDGSERFPVSGDLSFPMIIEPRGLGAPPSIQAFEYQLIADAERYQMVVTARLPGRRWDSSVVADVSYPVRAEPAIPQSTLSEQLAAHPYLRLDQDQQVLTIQPGTWRVAQSLIVPAGYSLQVDAGTTLIFSEDSALISRGALKFLGIPSSPVVLRADDSDDDEQSWPGIAVLRADALSEWRNVQVRDTRGIGQDGWELTGGVTFYESDVEMSACRFEDSHGEDALNIVRSRFALGDLTIRRTASDALDADFSEGTISGGLFQDIGSAGGGDGVDISGSQLTLTGAEFRRIADKAISTGERSRLTAEGIRVFAVGTGVASKDGSVAVIRDASISRASFVGLSAYIKKPEYGSARIEAEGIDFTDNEREALAQTGSTIIIDGVEVDTEDVDVDLLYETIMRPALRQ